MAEGQHVGGIIGFLRSLNLLIETHRPKECVIVWEGGGSSRRRSIYPDYKGGRKPQKLNRFHDGDIPDSVDNKNWQVEALIAALKNLPIRQLYISDCEADDVIGYLSKYSYKDSRVVIVSSDHDYLQLVDNRIQVWSPIKKKMYDVDAVHEEFGVHPNNMVIYRSFTGDASDNIPGVHGIGPKTILKLVPELSQSAEFSVDDLLDKSRNNLKESKSYQKILDNARIIEQNYQLMNIKLLDIPAQTASKIRGIMEQPISELNKPEFQRLFYEDKMWAIMKNLPEWLNNTWLSLNAFAKQTHK